MPPLPAAGVQPCRWVRDALEYVDDRVPPAPVRVCSIIVRVDTPETVYRRPADRFMVDFIGNRVTNFFDERGDLVERTPE